jgi:hypothetical protein
MVETEPKPFRGFRISDPSRKFNVTCRDLQVSRRWVGKTFLSLDEPEFSTTVFGKAVATREDSVCVFRSEYISNEFNIFVNSDEKIRYYWDLMKDADKLTDKNLDDPEQMRVRNLRYKEFEKSPPTAVVFNQGNYWSMECRIPVSVLKQLSSDLVAHRVDSVNVEIQWVFGFADELTGIWGFFDGGELQGHVSVFKWSVQGNEHVAARAGPT